MPNFTFSELNENTAKLADKMHISLQSGNYNSVDTDRHTVALSIAGSVDESGVASRAHCQRRRRAVGACLAVARTR